ncbi:MAG: regulatory signaling modulator protein AmpE [Gammaproteobacteria bacterium]
MTLIILLLGLALETFHDVFVKYRRFDWLIHVLHWLEKRLSRYRFWDGVPGVLLTLAGPLIVLLVIDYGLNELLVLLDFLFVTAVLVYSLGPDNLNTQLDEYVHACETGESGQVRKLAADIIGTENQDDDNQERVLLEVVLIRAHQRIFAIVFWFIVLGAFGALLYRLVAELMAEFEEIHGGYADAIRELYLILSWPSARLLALGFALSGSLVHALEGWGTTEASSLDVNDTVIQATGLGAIQYEPQSAVAEEEAGYWIREVKGLINRSLIVWLTVLGIMTLAGWLA